MPYRKTILVTFIVIAFLIFGAEVYFYYFNFNWLLKDRVFNFAKPNYTNGWLISYVSFAVVVRLSGLFNFLSEKKRGFFEYSFGQLMLIALLCKEFFRYTFYIYTKQGLETGNWKTLADFLFLFSIEIALLVYFYFASLKMPDK